MIGKVVLQIYGVNISSTMHYLKDKYNITDIRKVDNTTTNLTVELTNYKKVIDYFNSKCYNVKVLRFSFLLNAFLLVRKFCFPIIFGIICLAGLLILENITLGVMYSVASPYTDDIYNIVKNENVIGKFSHNVNIRDLENKILDGVPDISLVDVSTRGCFLIVNYTLKTHAIEVIPDTSGPLIAKDSGVVSKIFVTQGTPLVSIGTYVTKGQQLIGNYFIDKDGNTVECPARGQVYVYTWQSSTMQFCEDTIEYVPTGREMVCTTIDCFGSTISGKSIDIPYSDYTMQSHTERLFYFCIPLEITYITYQETSPVRVHVDFDSRMDALKMQAKEQVLCTLPIEQILEEKYTISTVSDVFYVTYYAKTESLIT